MKYSVFLSGLSLSIFVLIAGPAFAETWTCKFEASRGNGTPTKVIVRIDGNSGTTKVADSITNHYVGHPVTARSTRNTNASLGVRWEMPSIKDSAGSWIPGVVFSLFVEKSNGAARVTARPNGNYREVRSTGACKRQ